MFTSFKVNKSVKPTQGKSPKAKTVHQSQGVDARGYALMACDSCRARKLRCVEGDHPVGCTRCRATSATCLFTRTKSSKSSVCNSTQHHRRNSQEVTPTSGDNIEDQLDHAARSTDSTASFTPEHASRNSTPATDGQMLDTGYIIHSPGVLAAMNLPEDDGESDTRLTVEPHAGWDSAIVDFEAAQYPLWLQPSTPMEYEIQVPMEQASFPSSAAESRFGSPSPYTTPEGLNIHNLAHSTNTQLQSTLMTPNSHEPSSTTQSPLGERRCGCLESMLHLMERTGVERSPAETSALDGCLMCLRAGTHACNAVSACSQCNLCSDNTMLVTAVVRQLTQICCRLGELILKEAPQNGQSDRSGEDEQLGGSIWFGRYSIDAPEIRDSLSHSLALLHLQDLLSSLTAFKNEIGRRREAWKLVAECEVKIESIYTMVKQQGTAEKV